MEIGSEHVGRRLTVRHRLPDGSATDVVGRLLDVGPDALQLARRDGSEQVVRPTDVIVWKIVPDRPARRRRSLSADAGDLLRIASRGWPAIESVPLGDWELRASGGFTSRANSALVVGAPGIDLPDASDVVRRFHTTRGLPPLAQVVAGSTLEQGLLELGWRPASATPGGAGAIVQVADLDPSTTTPADEAPVRLGPTPGEGWWDTYHRIGPGMLDAARRVLTSPSVVGFAQVGDDPATAIGRTVVTGEWAGMAAVEVHPDHRRRGLGRRVVEASLAWAVAHGADKAYLHVVADNDAAIELYRPFGFVEHSRYVFLQADPLD